MPSTTQPSQYEVPPQLEKLLLDFTVSVLVEQPADVLNYAVSYFGRLKDLEDGVPYDSPALSNARTPESDDLLSDDEPDALAQKYSGGDMRNRRKSVFAEAYNPEEDEDDEDGKSIIHPKSDAQRKRLHDAVKNALVFKALDQQQINDVLDAMFEKKVECGDYVIKQGDDGDNFYVIESGVFNIFVAADENTAPKLVGQYDNSGSFGELALMYNQPRAATIQAASDGLLWGMDRQTFRKMVLRAAFKKRKLYESLLDRVPMLKKLNMYERMNLSDALVSITYPPNKVIIRQGDTADGMYFMEEGTVRVTVENQVEETGGGEGTQKTVELRPLGPGEYFGERALLTHEPRAATITTDSTVRVAFLDRDAFERLLGPCRDIMQSRFDDYERELAGNLETKMSVSDIR